MDGLTKEWIKLLDKIEEVDFKIMIPGHGKIQTDKSALKKTSPEDAIWNQLLSSYLDKLEV